MVKKAGAFLILLSAAALSAGSRFRTPDSATPLSFPRDHGSHDDARVEWWYVTGHLGTDSGRRLGYQLTFFRTGLLDEPRAERTSRLAARDLFLAHFALTDVSGGTFRFAERIHRSGLGAAEAREDRLAVVNEEWSLEEIAGRFLLHARDGDDEISLLLEPEKPLVLHGTNGLSRKGAEPEAVSRYVSFTRLRTAGWLSRGDRSEAVTGSSWLDHEWGSGLDRKGRCRMGLVRDPARGRARPDALPDPGEGREPARASPPGRSSRRTGRPAPSPRTTSRSRPPRRWKSPRSGGVYPARWRIRVPGAALDLDVVPLVADQELVTEKSTRVTYWEGACAVSSPEGRPAGRAYVELTGYAGEGALGLFR